MSQPGPPSRAEVLRSLELIRSAHAPDRIAGLHILSGLLHDPRVQQVFEYLYHHDPDAEVRLVAWAALTQHGPTVSALKPEALAAPPAEEQPREPGRGLFLLTPAHAPVVPADLLRRESPHTGRGFMMLLLGGLLFGVGLLWGLVLASRELRRSDDLLRDWRLVAALGGSVLLLLLLIVGRLWRRSGEPHRDGVVIPGELLSHTSHLDEDGDLCVKFRYQFTSPTGKVITGQISQIRNDLKHTPLPAPGTRIAVLYRSDTSYHPL